MIELPETELETVQLDHALDHELSRRKLEFFDPYPKQRDFYRIGGQPGVIERLLMAANQVGKTLGAGAEIGYHVTGRYPDWWDGKRFAKAPVGWVGAPTSQNARDNPQRILLGQIG